MSSKRGRKRNDNLPPNRARDVQRAFRARRAAHLQALESRVTELEEENNCLRAALNLPPANRPPLGKGPTGKDKPKSLDNQPVSSSLTSKSRDSSPIADSPSPRRSESTSPSLIGTSLRTPPIMEGNHWNDGFMINDQQPTPHPPHISSAPSSVAYNLRTLPSATVPQQKSSHQFTFSAPPSRPAIASNVAGNSVPSTYQQSTDRPLASGYNDMNYLLCDVRDNTHYSYQYHTSPFSNDSALPAASQQVPVHSQTSPTAPRPSLPPALSFQPRRPLNEPTSFRSHAGDIHLPSPTPHHSATRLASPPSPVLHDVRSHYASHGKQVNALP
ncbi:hypothetical protein EV401DRAFT_1913871 [Pisolithus croceorrhizus]|nr:hypothetical protein EV401DRAFT_1913871 [Pisolithus croceorrhizus]